MESGWGRFKVVLRVDLKHAHGFEIESGSASLSVRTSECRAESGS